MLLHTYRISVVPYSLRQVVDAAGDDDARRVGGAAEVDGRGRGHRQGVQGSELLWHQLNAYKRVCWYLLDCIRHWINSDGSL